MGILAMADDLFSKGMDRGIRKKSLSAGIIA